MMKAVVLGAGLVGVTMAAPTTMPEVKDTATEVEDTATEHGRELFPNFAMATKKSSFKIGDRAAAGRANPVGMTLGDLNQIKGPAKTLEMLRMNDEMNTVVYSDNMCTRRHAMARAAGLAAGLALSQISAPGFAAETKMVKMGSDAGQLVFVPDEIKICKGDTVTWTNNKGGPHNVVFDEDNIPSGVDQASISMEDQLGEEGETYSKKFDVAGTYGYYCEPHRGAGMNGNLIVS
jgi:plastocyanin